MDVFYRSKKNENRVMSRTMALAFGLCLASCANFDSEGSLVGLMLVGGSQGGVASSASPGFIIDSDNALLTSESGTATTVTVALTARPNAIVFIGPTVSDTSEASVAPASLAFTPEAYDVPQTVTVTGVDDAVVDGNQGYQVNFGTAASEDGGYNFQPVGTLSATNVDDDGTPGITLSPSSGLVTTEAGGTADFFVVLNNQPTASVTVAPASGDTSEAASPGALVFTTANWNVPQKVTVTGADDSIEDGTVAYTMGFNLTSGDAGYNALGVGTVWLSNTDDDTAGITVTPTTGLAVTEGGVTDNFSIVLNSEPTANVTIPLSVDDATEGSVPASVVFTSANWNVPQSVTVSGVNEFIIDGNQTFNVITGGATSTDLNYNGMDPDDVAATNGDDDVAGFLLSATSGLITGEDGTADNFTVQLTAEPQANVVIPISSDNTAEGTIGMATLTFTPLNWNIAQTVTITGVDDTPPVADGAIAYNIVLDTVTTTDPDYTGLDPSDVAVTNSNDDNVGFVVNISGNRMTTEAGGTFSFTVELATFPADNVTLGDTGDLIRSLDITEATVSPSTLTWTPAMWNTAQTVTVTGVGGDATVDANTAYQVDLGVGVSVGDTAYDGLAPPDSNGGTAGDLSFTNCDIDTTDRVTQCLPAGANTFIRTRENGATGNGYFMLTQAPAANVTVPFSSNDATEYSVTTPTLTFTTANWDTPQTVTLAGVDDYIDDGNILGTLSIDPLTSTDGYYNTYDPADPSTRNDDNDARGFTVSAVSNDTDEDGTNATFTIRLRSQPDDMATSVTFNITSLDTTEVTVSPASMTFTATGAGGCGGGGNWCTNQTVTLTGVDDALLDGTVTATIDTAAASAGATDYNGLNPANRTVDNLDTNDKRVFLSASTHNGDFDNDVGLTGGGATNGDGNPIGEADQFCAIDANYPGTGTYKALLVDGANRVGSVTANLGDGQVDWPLTANHRYFRSADSLEIFQADANGIFVFSTLTNNFTNPAGAGTDLYWTGLNADWTTSANVCTSWNTSALGNGAYGDGFNTDATSIFSTTAACTATRRVLCVEQ